MVEVEMPSIPDSEEIKEFVQRVQPTGALDRGVTASRVLRFDPKEEVLTVDFELLKRVLLEHQQFEQARAFSVTAMDLLRILENGPDRMRYQEILDEAISYYEERGEEPPKEATIRHNLQILRDQGLVDHEQNSYTYVGP